MKKFQTLMKSRFENAKKGNKGFSLVELIVAVVIIGIIAVVAFGELYSNVTKSRKNTDVLNAQSIQLALSTLSADKDVYQWATKSASTACSIEWSVAQTYTSSSHKYTKVGTTGSDATDTAGATELVTGVYLGDKINTILTDGLPAAKAGGNFELTITPDGKGNVTILCRVYDADSNEVTTEE